MMKLPFVPYPFEMNGLLLGPQSCILSAFLDCVNYGIRNSLARNCCTPNDFTLNY